MENEEPEMTNEELEEILGFARQGELEAQKMLGYMYSTQDDYKNAHYWFTEAGKQNDFQSIYALAILYKAGKGVPRSIETFYQLLTISAKGGCEQAIQLLSEWNESINNNL